MILCSCFGCARIDTGCDSGCSRGYLSRCNAWMHFYFYAQINVNDDVNMNVCNGDGRNMIDIFTIYIDIICI